MSNQFGHNRDRRRQSQLQAAASGLAALGRQAGSASQFGGGRPIQQHPSLAGSVAGSTVHGASAAAMGAYGSIGSAPQLQQGSIGAPSPFGINLGQQQPFFEAHSFHSSKSLPLRDVSSRYVTLPVTCNGGYFR